MIKNIYEVVCDICDESYIYDSMESWADLMESMQDDGWRSKKKDEAWEHYCASCRY